MHVTYQKVRFDILRQDINKNIFTEHVFGHKRKIDHFDPYSVFLAIAIPVLLMNGFVVQGHK